LFEFLAFSAGPRACPGYGFAMNALKVALAVVIQRYRVSLEPAANVSYWVRPLLYPSGEIRAVLRRQDGAFKAEPIGGNIRRLVRFAA
jgi:cytochrome P450